jgi:AraC-like DNA-binding protein
MREVCYEFEELESDASFEQFGKAFQGSLQQNTLQFNSPLVQGELVKKAPEDGLWIRKWKLTVLQKVNLHRRSASEGAERKFSLIYFLNPSIFNLKEGVKKVHLNTQRNIMFLSNERKMDFAVVPKQPFYVLDITFTAQWFCHQFKDAEPNCQETLNQQLKQMNVVLMECCSVEEFKLLHELDTLMQAGKEDVLFVKSRAYQLICSFFSKALLKVESPKQKQKIQNYEQIVLAEAMLIQQLQKPPRIVEIARQVNMSASSLLRQFKQMYGKSLHEYYTGKKMEMARRMVMENKMTIKKLAESLGYKQASHFIETFTKYHGYSPGSLKSFG